MSLRYEGKNLTLAKNLREAATPQEKRLWYDFLSSYSVRFQRQKPIDNFIADFYCHRAKLVIEIDGAQHFSEEGKKKDAFRTEQLENYGLTVVRFTNDQIDTNFYGVCRFIDQTVKERISDCTGQKKQNK